MRVLLENQLIDKYQFGFDGPNLLGFDTLEEVFFDVFEIKSKNYQIIKEKKSSKNDMPVINIDVIIDNLLYKDITFELTKENIVRINRNTLNRNSAILLEQEKPKLIKEEPKKQLIKESNTKIVKPKIKKEKVEEKSPKEIIKENTKEAIKQLILSEPDDKDLFRFFESYTEKINKKYIEIAEKIARRESMRAMESGGGGNAVQFANGGTMDGNLTVTGIIHGNVEGAAYKKSFTIGDSINNIFNLAHNLNTYDVVVSVYDINTKEQVYPSIQNTSPNITKIEFIEAIPDDSYRVVILG
jgi:hypothetical protein